MGPLATHACWRPRHPANSETCILTEAFCSRTSREDKCSTSLPCLMSFLQVVSYQVVVARSHPTRRSDWPPQSSRKAQRTLSVWRVTWRKVFSKRVDVSITCHLP